MNVVIQMDIEVIKDSLNENEVLTDDVKSDLFELVLIFNKSYPEIRLDKLAERLRTLKFEVVSRFICKDVMHYNDKLNKLQINEDRLEETDNTKHILMVSLLHMITLNDKDQEGLLTAFRDGYANIIADNLVGRM